MRHQYISPTLQQKSLTVLSIDGIKKTELEIALEDYLVENESQLANEARLIPYYNRRSGASPVKKEPSSAHDEIDTKRSLRRRTRLASELSEVGNQTTYVLRRANRVNLLKA